MFEENDCSNCLTNVFRCKIILRCTFCFILVLLAKMLVSCYLYICAIKHSENAIITKNCCEITQFLFVITQSLSKILHTHALQYLGIFECSYELCSNFHLQFDIRLTVNFLYEIWLLSVSLNWYLRILYSKVMISC